jgi:hypothetical protein
LKPRLYEELEDYGSNWIEELPKVVWGCWHLLLLLLR